MGIARWLCTTPVVVTRFYPKPIAEIASLSKNPSTTNLIPMRKPRAHQVRARISLTTNEQLESFLRAEKEHGAREHAMFLFAVAHGARASEICNLRISDLNFKSEQVHVARLKGSLDSTQTLMRVKGNSLFNETAA